MRDATTYRIENHDQAYAQHANCHDGMCLSNRE